MLDRVSFGYVPQQPVLHDLSLRQGLLGIQELLKTGAGDVLLYQGQYGILLHGFVDAGDAGQGMLHELPEYRNVIYAQ